MADIKVGYKVAAFQPDSQRWDLAVVKETDQSGYFLVEAEVGDTYFTDKVICLNCFENLAQEELNHDC